jgi:hypothetical protein
MVLMDETVETDYGQFDIVWGEDGAFVGDWDVSFAGHVNGLVGAANPCGVYVNLSSRGGAPVRIVLEDAAPELPEERYEDVVEVSVIIPPGAVATWQSWAGESQGALAGLSPGSYRLRVSAHGRAAARRIGREDGATDEYLLQFWAAEPASDAVVRVGSADAEFWHREIGGRR